jgi:hypothetical protein
MRRGQHEVALQLLQRVFSMDPALRSPDVRVGMAYCFYQLGLDGHAERAFQRILAEVAHPTTMRQLGWAGANVHLWMHASNQTTPQRWSRLPCST